MSEIDNLINVLSRYFYITPSNITLVLSVLFTLYVSWLTMNKTKSSYAAIAGAFVPITICTVLGFVPIIVYALIAVSLSMILAGKIVGVI